MRQIWTYLVVVLCGCMTSARVLDFPGNKDGLQDNIFSTLEKEKVLTPPSDSGLIIDSNGYPGNSNGPNIKEVNPNNSPLFSDEIINAALNGNNQLADFNIILLSREDIIHMENSDICKSLCMDNIKNALCNCKKEN